MSAPYHKFSFEVFGKVQGVFFRKNTKLKALDLSIVGWVRNTKRGTVEGVAEGSEESMDHFEYFLTNVGSKMSRIDECQITNRETINDLEFDIFEIKKTV
eukprot:TRINITY_DN1035_c0_g1_i1.p1 TRINITY_DN1035_c0_g1~~TRINITY_DN1035_c0_g1_i1.p1  ORF type:complete len:100 (+),score=28.95 TRINITY_DN1035_c0_g1_i1:34-333(+)